MTNDPNLPVIPASPETLRSFDDVWMDLNMALDTNHSLEIPVELETVRDIQGDNTHLKVKDCISYDENAAFVDMLVKNHVILAEDRMSQINLCDNWNLVEFEEWRDDMRRMNGLLSESDLPDLRNMIENTNAAWNGNSPKIRVENKTTTDPIRGVTGPMPPPKPVEPFKRISSFTGSSQEYKDPFESPSETYVEQSPSRDLGELANFRRTIEQVRKNTADRISKGIKSKLATTINPPRVHCYPGTTEIIGSNGIAYSFGKNDPISVKVGKIKHLVEDGVMTLKQLRAFATPELNAEVVDMYRGLNFDVENKLDMLFSEKDEKDEKVIQKVIRKEEHIKRIDTLIDKHGIKPEDLEKLAALKVIDDAALKVWRIRHQEKNRYFYDEDFSEPYEIEEGSTETEEETEAIETIVERILSEEKKSSSFVDTLKSDVTDAGVRIISTQAVLAAKTLIANAIPEDKAEIIRSFLNTELGTSVVSMMAGMALTYGMADNEHAQVIAEELRVHSMATAGNEVINGIREVMPVIIRDAVKELPDDVEEVEEDLPEEEEKIVTL